MTGDPWSVQIGWADLRRGGEETLTADAPTRIRIARFLDLEALSSLTATLTHRAWLDGVSIRGRVEAAATRLCGVTLEPFEERVDTDVELRLVPAGSVNAPALEVELDVSLDAEDPPEVVTGDQIDLGRYVVEALGLGLDPFPRKPGATFDYVDPAGPMSPFAVLKFPRSGDGS